MQVQADLSQVRQQIPKDGKRKEMLSVKPLDDGRIKISINSSSLGIIQSCMRKAKYVLNDQWLADHENPATKFGSAIHKALEVFYLGQKEERVLPKALEDQAELIGFGNRYKGENLILRAIQAFADVAEPLKALPAENKRSIPTGAWMLSHYFRDFIDDPFVVLVDDQGPFVERTFRMPILDGPQFVIEYFGTIDVVLKNEATGQILVCDHKTSSVVGNDFYNRMKPNHQYTGYLLGARKVFGLQTYQFLVNCLQVKQRPKTAQGSAPHFVRQVTGRDEYDFQEFIEAVIAASTLYFTSMQTVAPIGHVDSCAMYGGCQFLPVCSSPKAIRDSVMQSKFKQPEEAK